MPVFDTPITTDEANLNKVLGQRLPVVLYLFDKPNKALDDAFQRVAKENAGELLVARIDASKNPQVYERFNRPLLPALVTLDEGKVESKASNIRPDDVDAHADFLLGDGPLPTETAVETEARTASGAAPVHVTDLSFNSEVLQSRIPVLVDFWAPWCGPCHMVAPVLERIAQQYAGRIKVAKLNVDDNQRVASQYQARSIPMLLMFKGGKQVGKLVGAHPEPNIKQLVEQALR
jgi:thioredoxin 1